MSDAEGAGGRLSLRDQNLFWRVAARAWLHGAIAWHAVAAKHTIFGLFGLVFIWHNNGVISWARSLKNRHTIF